MQNLKHLPTQNGYYWVLQDIGVSEVRCVCWVAIFPNGSRYFPEGGVYLVSPWSVYTEPLAWNPELHNKQFVPWDPAIHRAWEGPIDPPNTLTSVRTGERVNWLENP